MVLIYIFSDFLILLFSLQNEANLQGIPPSPPLPLGGGPNAGEFPEETTCEMEVDGVVVTNIPSSAVNHVHSIVKYFEQMAIGQAQNLHSEPSSEDVASSISGGASSISFGEDPGSTPGGASGMAQWSPLPTTGQRLRDFLPPRNGCTPARGVGLASLLATPGAHPRAPAPSPYNEVTPPPQRLHRQTLDALAALQAYQSPVSEGAMVVSGAEPMMMTNYHPSAALSQGDVIGPTPGQTEVSAESIGPIAHPGQEIYGNEFSTSGHFIVNHAIATAPGVPSTHYMDVSPMDLAALQQAGGNGLRDEVRARLSRLKADLQAARSKLSYVDRGLAAIATPPPTRTAAGQQHGGFITGPSAPEFEYYAQYGGVSPGPSMIAAGMVTAMAAVGTPGPPHLTPALAGPTPRNNTVGGVAGGTARPTTRPSVRFADSVNFGNDDDSSSDDEEVATRRRKPIPRTPGISSTSARASTAAYITSGNGVGANGVGGTSTMNMTGPSPGATIIASTMKGGMISQQQQQQQQQLYPYPNNQQASAAYSQAYPGQRSPASSFAMLALGGNNHQQQNQQSSVKKEYYGQGASEELTQAQRKATPLHRRLDLGHESESDSDDDVAPPTHGSTRSRMGMGTDLRGASGSSIKAFYAPSPGSRTPLAHQLEYAGRSPFPAGASNSPLLSRFSSVSSGVGPAVPPSPQNAALVGIRPTVVRGRRNGGNNRRVSNDAEEKEFRRRAAALKIHVSPYFKRAGQRPSRDEIDPSITVD